MTITRRGMLAALGNVAIWPSGTIGAAAASSDIPAGRTNMEIEIKRSGSEPSRKGPAEWFTGTVRIDPVFPERAPARASAGMVTFEPGARTAWHTHPLGQTLIVTAGCGWEPCCDGPKREIRAGVVVVCPPGEKHWHGATATTGMSHIAVQEALDGKVVEWLEKVSDEEYLAAPRERTN